MSVSSKLGQIMGCRQLHLHIAITVVFCISWSQLVVAATADAGDVNFGPNVLLFDPNMTGVQQRIDDVFATQERAQFGQGRYALLFKPGKYNLDVQIGFYTQVMGLGASPDDVSITGAVRSTARWLHRNALVNFWRCAENLSVTPTLDDDKDIWAVSQGTALRRVHVRGDLNLWDGGYSSGGFMADSRIDGTVASGSQQQWLSRNDDWGSWAGGNWNMVFVGTTRPPDGSWPQKPYTVVDETPIIREKPFLHIDGSGKYDVIVPPLRDAGSRGVSWSGGVAIPIDRFYIAHPDTDTAASINSALAAGKNLLLTPGIYHLADSIRISRPDTVVLGLGYPTLIPDNGSSAMTVADVDGVKLAGILFQAGAVNSPELLEVGETGAAASHARDPIFLYDIFCRAGGAEPGSVGSFVTINSNDVVGDNFWLWRADHGHGVGWDKNKAITGLKVNGNRVTMYGLFVEHCQGYQTLWNGNFGRVYMYQSEMPYDPPSQSAWSHDDVRGYASYKVGNAVTTHQAWGLGVYCVFRSASVVADNAFETPSGPGIRMQHLIVFRLGGQPGSGICHIINGEGGSALSNRKATFDSTNQG